MTSLDPLGLPIVSITVNKRPGPLADIIYFRSKVNNNNDITMINCKFIIFVYE
jgi:hypothetical protein